MVIAETSKYTDLNVYFASGRFLHKLVEKYIFFTWIFIEELSSKTGLKNLIVFIECS